ncbi:MAG: polyprenyl synthetase family protein [Candidatus Diapherotrites archaeon]|nr:polyprenyl synthetase family protein [Candidatus Diapherotrites archaeon]
MKFKEKLGEYRNTANNEITSFFREVIEGTDVPIIKDSYGAMLEYIMRGGKRLRPASVMAAYLGVTGKEDDAIRRASISVELFHNATLLHDDFMDRDVIRRGKPTYHKEFEQRYKEERGATGAKRFGECMATIGGNMLYTLGYRALSSSGAPAEQLLKALHAYESGFIMVNHGQMEDINFERRKGVTEDDYMRMITGKTSYLFKTSVQIGAHLGYANAGQLRALEEYSIPMAQAFQVQDDILGVFGEEESLGKSVGIDIKEGKNTLLLIKARELSNEKQGKRIDAIFGNSEATDAEVAEGKQLLVDTGALDYSKNKCLMLAKLAKQCLRKAEFENEAFDFFDGFADYVIEREY